MTLSILVPFKDDGGTRAPVWKWLKQYWEAKLPDVELIVGTDDRTPFSKSVAINDAASRASGDVFAMLDADAYVEPSVLRRCANLIETADEPTWFIPYGMLFRLTLETSTLLMKSDPADPMRMYVDGRLPRERWEEAATNDYGAMLQIFPRAAFEKVGGMDERFRGWGGEDHALVRALDTLYAPHLTTRNYLYHLWHERPGSSPTTRTWKGQTSPRANLALIQRYRAATGHPRLMARLITGDER